MDLNMRDKFNPTGARKGLEILVWGVFGFLSKTQHMGFFGRIYTRYAFWWPCATDGLWISL